MACLALSCIATSCKSVYSTTSIEPRKAFVLGDNDHGAFEVTIKNVSAAPVDLVKVPNGGAREYITTLQPRKSASLRIEQNVALYVENKSNDKVSVELNLQTNTHLSMGYKE